MSALLLPVLDTAFSLNSHFSRFLIFFKIFPLRSLLDRSSLIHNLELPLSKPKDCQTLDFGKVYFLTMRNVVADLTVINTEAARFFVCLCVCMYVV